MGWNHVQTQKWSTVSLERLRSTKKNWKRTCLLWWTVCKTMFYEVVNPQHNLDSVQYISWTQLWLLLLPRKMLGGLYLTWRYDIDISSLQSGGGSGEDTEQYIVGKLLLGWTRLCVMSGTVTPHKVPCSGVDQSWKLKIFLTIQYIVLQDVRKFENCWIIFSWQNRHTTRFATTRLWYLKNQVTLYNYHDAGQPVIQKGPCKHYPQPRREPWQKVRGSDLWCRGEAEVGNFWIEVRYHDSYDSSGWQLACLLDAVKGETKIDLSYIQDICWMI